MIIHPTNENVAVEEYLSSKFDIVLNVHDNLDMLSTISSHIVGGGYFKLIPLY